MNDNALYLIAFGIASQLVQNWRGFKTLGEKVANHYVPLADYRAKVSELHGIINAQALDIARLQARADASERQK